MLSILVLWTFCCRWRRVAPAGIAIRDRPGPWEI
jgi:hypothetical protein